MDYLWAPRIILLNKGYITSGSTVQSNEVIITVKWGDHSTFFKHLVDSVKALTGNHQYIFGFKTLTVRSLQAN